jgi:Predicted transcriptional regulators
MYTVKEVAEKLNLTEHTVRFYTDRGLVPNLQRDKNNIRIFDEAAVDWLICVKCLKECGMSIESIKNYIELCQQGDSTIPARYEIVLEQSRHAYAQLEEARQRAKYMEKKVQHYYNIINNGIPDNTNPKNWDKERCK